ncbi:glycosyltransferase [Frankia casuarinae]|jgi:glycosyltransferase involved in cell wall biosynthesis|uniref:Glycosyl transferase, group 1 n=1 Tax=Frankia casuarinae (strain DSM 45818 / CECT 9043 / HFP020203 / CcI3) TaxID=106370 RepID=Q2J694_FRACC|nr:MULTISPECIES: glycosyltransferase family 4 protein [Frankia]KDA41511.1 glycosyltransferase [Frankia sp. BMG5.23]TFE25709.1 glycosyltransferase family 1 protein [Frankia sp. B2]ABD13198.1 glycosyl transferase, group 1 [Frankia casuarinae]ETA00550.1 glycosyltransferase [Frankia sp. CcI6]EYT93718.1 glycosyltransferase [Frankia casuarinae]
MGTALRVLQVAARFFPDMGGTETHVYETSRRLNATSDITVEILTTDRSGKLPSRENVAGTVVHRVAAWPQEKDYYLAPAVAKVVGFGSYDLVHCQGIHNLVPPVAMAAARLRGIPYIVSPHTGGHSSQVRNTARRVQWGLLGPLIRNARRVICVAEFESHIFMRQAGVAADRISVVPNGVSIVPPSGHVKPDTSEPLVVCVGRLEKYKGQRHLVRALPSLITLVPDVRLMLVGRGPDEPELRRLADRLGVVDRVSFTSIPPEDRQAMSDCIARAGVVALLSEYEAHPVAVMEAVALGRPVVVAPTAGLGELAAAGLAQSVADPADEQLVAKTLGIYLLASAGDSPSETRPTPEISTLPTWDGCAEALARIYRESV